jgi:hypothetical protein
MFKIFNIFNMRKFFITFAVAVLLGYVRATSHPTETKKQEAIQNIAFIPSYATPAHQAAINKNMSAAYGTP